MDGEQPASAAGAARTPEEDAEPGDIEAVARCVYEAMRVAASPYVETPRWTEGGNSTRQDEARRAAARIVALMKRRTAPAAMTTPTTAEQIEPAIKWAQSLLHHAAFPDPVSMYCAIPAHSVEAAARYLASVERENEDARATIARLEGEQRALHATVFEAAEALGMPFDDEDTRTLKERAELHMQELHGFDEERERQQQRADAAERERVAAINEMAKARRIARENEDDAMLLRTLLSLDYERGGSGLLLGVHSRARAAEKALQAERTRADAAERRVEALTGDEAVEAAAKALQYHEAIPAIKSWDKLPDHRRDRYRSLARAALAAASGAADGAVTTLPVCSECHGDGYITIAVCCGNGHGGDCCLDPEPSQEPCPKCGASTTEGGW